MTDSMGLDPLSIDTGIPSSYDPQDFYEYRIMKYSKTAVGVEGLIYKYIPWSIIRSFAFAIDPFSRFKIVGEKISPGNRIRKRGVTSVLDVRSDRYTFYSTTDASWPNYFGPGGFGPLRPVNPPVTSVSTNFLTKQATLPWESNDTTYRTRELGIDMGEFKKTRSEIFSPPRSTRSVTTQLRVVTGLEHSMPDIGKVFASRSHTIGPSAATLSLASYNTLVTGEHLALLAHMQKSALKMYTGLLPTHRNYTLFRNIVELRDLPRGIRQLMETAKHLRSSEAALSKTRLGNYREILNRGGQLARDVPKEYVSYCFGWAQLYRDIKGLMTQPEKISRQIDFLIRRSGKASTYRTIRKITDGATGVPGFTYDLVNSEYGVQQSTSVAREIELRLVVNCAFEFPTINSPKFKDQVFRSKLGVIPTATDIYNLIPWTWLVDWFTGLGDYISVIDTIHQDGSLINWGVVTGVCQSDVTTNWSAKLDSLSQVKIDSPTWVDTITTSTSNHSSVLRLHLQNRKDLRSLMSVKTTADPSTLTAYQRSILGALIAIKGTKR